MRCREFLMKDMYFFATTDEENAEFYEKATQAYQKVFERLGLGGITFITSASGGMFTDKFSHEFQTVCDAGEDVIYVNQSKQVALNGEVFNKETLDKMGMKEEEFEKKKAAEIGNIFNFGTSKSEQLGLYFKDRDGKDTPVHLSSYGIGITRLMGVLVEVNGKGNSMIWSPCTAPFKYHIIEINSENPLVGETCRNVYEILGRQALYDDRDLRAGEKFNDADLIGIPLRIIVSEKNVLEGKIEFLDRRSGQTKMIAETELKDYLEKC
jgi:prolyl-tRNA synthetase